MVLLIHGNQKVRQSSEYNNNKKKERQTHRYSEQTRGYQWEGNLRMGLGLDAQSVG